MNWPRVTIQIVTYNSRQYLPECLRSIFDQTYRDFQVLIIDNASQDRTVDWLKANYPQVAVFQNNRNLGFAKAHNQGLKLLNSPYVVICNPDIILESNWLAKIMSCAQSEKYLAFGSFGGKLLKLKVNNLELNDVEKTKQIDSCGLKIFKNHRVVELGAGETSSAFTVEQEIFGCSGALTLFKREALQSVFLKTSFRPQGEYFDEDFFFYKEDIDLAWRLRLAGWRSLMVPPAVAYHIRSLGGSEKKGPLAIIYNRRRQSRLARYYSYRNHWLFLIKDEFIFNLLKYLPSILYFEAKKFVYASLAERLAPIALAEVIKLLPRMLVKRTVIFKQTKTTAADLRRWFV
jgi:GT2 family glycosyltransferase